MQKTLIAVALASLFGLSTSVIAKPVSKLDVPQTSTWLAKNGADNAPGDQRRGRGADDGAGHAKNGADDGAGDDNGFDGAGHA